MTGEVILYQTEDGAAQISLRAMDGTVWLTQAEMAALFDTSKQSISLHLRNIFADGELVADSVVKESLIPAADGKTYATQTYSGKLRMEVAQQLAADRFADFDAARKQADAAQADTDDLAAIEALAKDLSRDRGKG